MIGEESTQLHDYLDKLSYIEQLKYIVKQFPSKYNRVIESKRSKDLKVWINEQTPLLQDNFYKIKTKVYWVLHQLKDFPKCKLCGKPFTNNVKLTIGYPTYCKNCINSKDSDRTKKAKATNLKRFGSYTNFGTKEFKEQVIKTNLKKYGVDNCMKSNIVKDNYKKAIFKKYGVTSIMQLQSSLDKIQMHRKLKIKNAILTSTNVEPIFNVNAKINELSFKKTTFWWQCMKCQHVFNAHITSYKHIAICPFCKIEHKHAQSNHSQYEIEITQFIKTAFPNLEVIYHRNEINRHIIYPSELDIWIPEKRIAIEFNGTFWHSTQFDDRHHLNKKFHLFKKTTLCEQKNIHLIHIYEDDWIYRNSEQKELILKLINKQNDIYNYKFIELPHDKYPSSWSIPNYKLDHITEPELCFHSKCKRGKQEIKNYYTLYDCGKLIFKRNNTNDKS